MKILKKSKAYGVLEYTVIIALVIVAALIILSFIKGKTGTLNIPINTAFSKVNEFIGTSSEVPVEQNPSGITVTYSNDFNYDYEKELSIAIQDYFTSFATVKDKNKNIRTDYVLENISKINGFVQVDVKVDEDSKREQILINEICHLATDADFSGDTNGTFKYIGTAKCVEIPHVIKGVSVTSYEQMFGNTSVEKVISTNLNVTNMTAMFNNSQSTFLDLSNFNTSNVTDMNGMFRGSRATSLDLSSFDTSKVTTMYSMFWDSKAIFLDLSNFNTSNVTTMGCMFRDSQVISLNLSSFDTSNVTNMNWMFTNNKAVSLDLLNFNTSNVTNMSYMFSGSYATSLDLSSFNTSNVTDMWNIFNGSQATTGYARTTADRDKFNASSNKPAGLTFIVKP